MSSGTGPTVPLSVIIPTRDEERNLRETLSTVVDWADQVFVFDSFSVDRTLEIARQFKVDIVQRRFDNFASHKNWALDHLPIRNQWILLLDADERLTRDARDEIAAIVCGGASPNGYYIARKTYFMGQWIRHGGMFPDWQLRLLRRGKGRYEDRIVHEHIVIDGTTAHLRNALEHNDFKGLERWFDRHNQYSSMEAVEVRRLLEGDSSKRIRGSLFSRGPERTRKIKEFAYRYLPARALWVFIWMYLVRGGFLDGRIGFRYCILRAFVDYQISLKVIELHSESEGKPWPQVAGADLTEATMFSNSCKVQEAIETTEKVVNRRSAPK